jgi:CRISPR-associated protein Csm1
VDQLQHALLAFGVWLTATRLGQSPFPDIPADVVRLTRARQALGDQSLGSVVPPAPAGLVSIFSFVRDDRDPPRPTPAVVLPLQRLSLDLARPEAISATELWTRFQHDRARLPAGAGRFDTFTTVMARNTWFVAGTLGLPGVSVFEQYRTTAAVAHALGEADDDVLLVAGDLSGIQEMLYTISSRGAAKMLRGRSLYLELLVDAVVRALLRALQLPAVCLMTSAGGNFLLLARPEHRAQLDAVRRAIEERLFALHDGELALALAWSVAPARMLADARFADRLQELADAVDAEKARVFSRFARERPALFAPLGTGSTQRCVVCHVELPPDAVTELVAPEELRCDQCESFRERPRGGAPGLAGMVARTAHEPLLTIGDLGGLRELPAQRWRGRPAWHEALRVFGYQYHFGEAPPQFSAATRYRLNDVDCLVDTPHPDYVYGFRWLANTTPRIAAHEVPALRTWIAQRPQAQPAPRPAAPDLPAPIAGDPAGETTLQAGDIRSTLLMAEWDSTGVARYGILHMDIDNLGTLFRERLDPPALPRITALSAALELFFEGWLNRACERAVATWRALLPQHVRDEQLNRRDKLPYLLYAGGDDLLIAGPWDVLPTLAGQIHDDFARYVASGAVTDGPLPPHAPITLSAGLFAEAAPFPFYQAVEQASVALSASKRRRVTRTVRGDPRPVVVKDAITLIGTTLSWDAFRRAERLALQLAGLIDIGVARDDGGVDRASHALIQLLAEVARLYAAAGGDVRDEAIVYGRWMPVLAYGLHRTAERVPQQNPALRQAIIHLGGETLDLRRVAAAADLPTIRLLGLAARWAEYLIRKGGNSRATAE